MLSKRIIPCLDVTDGRVVKGTNFVNLRDAGDPVELAKRYNDEGADELVFLDITATSNKEYVLTSLIEKTAKQVFIPLTIGGGINSVPMIRNMLNAGADKLSINSAAIHDPELVVKSSQAFGSQCIVVAIDARRITENPEHEKKTYDKAPVGLSEESQWEIYTHGGRHATGIDAIKWAQFMDECGAGELLVTSMDADGTKAGYDVELTQKIASTTSIPVIASGGAGNTQHIVDVLHHCNAALLASLLHFRELSIDEIKEACIAANHTIRH